MPEKNYYLRVDKRDTEDRQTVTQVSVVDIQEDSTVIATWIESEYFRTRWGYNRAISKEVEDSLRFMGSLALASREATSS